MVGRDSEKQGNHFVAEGWGKEICKGYPGSSGMFCFLLLLKRIENEE